MSPLVVLERVVTNGSARLLGITGPAGSGKSTTAQALALFNYHCLHLASPIYEAATRMLGREPNHDRDRELLVQVATQLREQSRYVLTEHATRTLARIPHDQPIVFDDVRSDDDAAFIRQQGGLVVALDVPIALRRARLFQRGATQIPTGPTERTPVGDFRIAIRATTSPAQVAQAIIAIAGRVAA